MSEEIRIERVLGTEGGEDPAAVWVSSDLPNDTPPEPEIRKSVATYPIATSLPIPPGIIRLEQAPPRGDE